MRITKTILKQINDDPVNFALNVSIDDLVTVIKKLADAYYNSSTPLVSDEIYDLIFETLKSRDPKNPVLKQTGSTVKVSRKKVKLSYPMGSLNKIKPNTGFIEKWLRQYEGPYVLSDKLDGISAQLLRKDNKYYLYTKGEGDEEGNIGEDISHLVELIQINGLDKLKEGMAVRGELIMSREAFKKHSKEFKNSRNLVSGVVNAKTLNKNIAKDVEFVAYAMLDPIYEQPKQMKELKKMGFNLVYNFTVESGKLTQKLLEDTLVKRRKESPYDIDGIVCVDSSQTYELQPGYPEHAFAFKMILDDQYASAKVTKVVWDVSKDSYLKPVVHIEPVDLVGVTVSKATAHNAKFVVDNKIGKGAIIKIIRSGDVIPYILDVETPAKKISEPNVPYKWNDSEVDYIVDYDQEVPEEIIAQVKVKNLTSFFAKIGVKYLSEGILTKFVDNGYDSIKNIITANKEELTEIEGLGEKIVKKIYDEIEDKLKKVKLSTFMAATNIFGFGLGETKIKDIIRTYPDIIHSTWTKKEMIENLNKIHGFSDISSTKFADKFKEFKQFLFDLNEVFDLPDLVKKVEKKKAKTKNNEKKKSKKGDDTESENDENEDKSESDNQFQNETIVFTGIRDKDLQETIESKGGKVTTSVSKNTTMVVTSENPDKSSSKYKKAVELKIKIYTVSEFKKKFNI